MKSRLIPAAGQFVISVLLVTLAAGIAAEAGDVALRVKGDDMVANAVQETGVVFQERHPRCVVIASGGGTSLAFQQLLEKHIELVVALRDPTQAERDAFAKTGIELVEHDLGWDGIAVIVHPSNPINDLTLEQCRKVFSGKYASWQEVGGSAELISLFIPSPEKYEIAASFRQMVLKGASYPRNCSSESHWKRVIAKVSQTWGAAGVCAARQAYQAGSGVKIMGIRETEASTAALPPVQTEYGESYPLRRPIRLFWDARSPLREHIEEFAAFCKSFGLSVYR